MDEPANDETTRERGVDDPARDFEAHRRHLVGLAYRMLGSVAEAEDAVQDAYLRWHRADRAAVGDARAFLSRTVARLCLDRLRAAKARRETYVGPWLPEPLLDAEALAADTASEYASDLSVGLLMALERLSPLERAAFLLHDVFDVGFAEVAALIGRSEAACRQLATRARAHVRAARPRFAVAPEEGSRLVAAFAEAVQRADASGLARLLAADAVLHSDGGGRKTAALNPIVGRDRVARFFAGIAAKFPDVLAASRGASINGLPGLIVTEADGSVQTLAFEIVDGSIAAIYFVRNPDKLAHLAPRLH
ncbi:sigma-70 family RNA polymerase sigma factor [Rhodoplanes sp. TEM]|uniref:Sigma-70 family RNA polymerase sigma factor n=1 Tax=Rhodoplanes tepidamans TaxID=200616 RepID=A0ABT5J6K3_RHOTP|nr:MULTISPECIES: sigma-70 family RNA polymerase sigma factor [Rhodoplanes]MDC7784909.1 sigma-70 family RNA polymerase sigma factor [Rhodoplanes tepidamans]MDC7983995.1 sigma-70 family RNA polymerase sigma factor [Rhodoplanes sp. TEM]MDQ0353862.1 RNA polymerase sigma-70 factor (ECF subfamily) [Rhodoplanes tepidamans]